MLHGFLVGLLSSSALEFLKVTMFEGETSVYVMVIALLLEVVRVVLFEGEIFNFMMMFVLHVVQFTLGALWLVMLLEDAGELVLPTLGPLSLLKLFMAEAGRCRRLT